MTSRRLPPMMQGLACVALLALVACRDTTDDFGPPGPPAGLMQSGGSARAFTGEALAQPVSVQVTDRLGRAVRGVRLVRFVASAGTPADTIVDTNIEGRAGVSWTLGASPGPQQLTASLVDLPALPSSVIGAVAVSPDSADVVIVQGASAAGDIGVMVRLGGVATELITRAYPDTIVRLLPRTSALIASSWEEASAFQKGHAPALIVKPWTDAVDTVRLALRAPVAVPFTVWITHDYAETAARVQYDLNNVDTFWKSTMVGLVVGDVQVRDAPGMNGTIQKCEDPRASADVGRMNVYYVSTMVGDNRPAYSCGPTAVLMGPNLLAYIPEYVLLMSHELGHSMALGHVTITQNLMFGYPWGASLMTGQVYRMHFDSYGTLNSVMGVHPAGERNCLIAQNMCPAETFIAW